MASAWAALCASLVKTKILVFWGRFVPYSLCNPLLPLTYYPIVVKGLQLLPDVDHRSNFGGLNSDPLMC